MSTALPELHDARDRLENALTISPADYSVLTDVVIDLVYRALQAGEIPAVRHGRRYRIPSAWVKHQLGLA